MDHRLSVLKPLTVGRIARVSLGFACLAVIPFVLTVDSSWSVVFAFLFAASLIVAGVFANPGCELTALPNLLLPRRYRLHFL